MGWRARLMGQHFYLLMALLIAAIDVYGFSQTVNQRLIHPAIPRPFVLYLHAAVYSGWVVFFILQTTLVRTGNVRWHRMTGLFGVALGTSVVALGVWTAIVMGRFNMAQLHRHFAPPILLAQFYDVLAFATPFVLAIYWRRKSEFHRRLMLVASCALTVAAISRMPILLSITGRISDSAGVNFLTLFVIFDGAGVGLLILLGVARDLIVSGRVHRVYVYALPAYIICRIVVAYTCQTPFWLKIARAILD